MTTFDKEGLVKLLMENKFEELIEIKRGGRFIPQIGDPSSGKELLPMIKDFDVKKMKFIMDLCFRWRLTAKMSDGRLKEMIIKNEDVEEVKHAIEYVKTVRPDIEVIEVRKCNADIMWFIKNLAIHRKTECLELIRDWRWKFIDEIKKASFDESLDHETRLYLLSLVS